MYDNSLIIRTSFGDTVFPYEKAFVDQWTSRLRVDVLAKKLVKLLESDLTGTIHVGGKRQTVMDYAKSISPDKAIGNLSPEGSHVRGAEGYFARYLPLRFEDWRIKRFKKELNL